MARRNPIQQSSHDKGVRREAEELERKGWNVKADLPDYHSPPKIGKENRIPDIYATKRGHTRIVEVETNVNDDRDQHSTFRRSAAQSQNKIFYWILVDSIGRRIEQFN